MFAVLCSLSVPMSSVRECYEMGMNWYVERPLFLNRIAVNSPLPDCLLAVGEIFVRCRSVLVQQPGRLSPFRRSGTM